MFLKSLFPSLLLSIILLGCGAGTKETESNAFTAKRLTQATATVIPQSGWWWNPSEGGRGFTIEVQNGNMFMAGYLYDLSGRASWYAAGPSAMSGSTFSSTLTTYKGGQTLTGTYHSVTNTLTSGNISIEFTDPSHGIMSWPGGTVPIERFNFGPGGANTEVPTGTPETGWWWNEDEGGRGYSIEIQGDTIFIAGYMYDNVGDPIWYVSGASKMINPTTYKGNWQQYGNGQTLTGMYKPAAIVNANAGNINVQFSSATTATLTLPDNRQIPIRRYKFPLTTSSAAPAGLYVGYYQEDPTSNPEDPIPGAFLLSLPNGNATFNGKMYFTYIGCQSSNVGEVTGIKSNLNLTGNWAGAVDNSMQTGLYSGTYNPSTGYYSGTYSNSGGKQYKDIPGCIRYYIAPNGTWEMFAIEQNIPISFTVNVVGNTASWNPPPNTSTALVYIVDVIAAQNGNGNPIKWQTVLQGAVSSTNIQSLGLTSGATYIAAVKINDATSNRIAFGSKKFIAP